MMTIRFPNGQTIQYNTANYVVRAERYSDIYEQKDGRWIAQIPYTCVIECIPACRVYDGLNREHDDALAKEVRAIRRKLQKTIKQTEKKHR